MYRLSGYSGALRNWNSDIAVTPASQKGAPPLFPTRPIVPGVVFKKLPIDNIPGLCYTRGRTLLYAIHVPVIVPQRFQNVNPF